MKNNQMILTTTPSVQVTPMSSYIEISIDREITAPEDFREEISAIRAAKEGDVISMIVGTDGGRLDTTHAIISAMRQCKAHIICEAVGTVASAGTIIFLSGHELRVNNHVEFMIHNSSSGTYGKTNNMAEYVNHQQKSIQALMEDVYKHFLTDEEIKKVLTGTDYYFDSDEVFRRLQLRQEAIEAEAKIGELTREELESWPHERLVSFICDEDYNDDEWEDTLIDTINIDDIETTQDLSVVKSAADSLGINYVHNIGIEKLRGKVLSFLED